jgi:hypothetical protein
MAINAQHPATMLCCDTEALGGGVNIRAERLKIMIS